MVKNIIADPSNNTSVGNISMQVKSDRIFFYMSILTL